MSNLTFCVHGSDEYEGGQYNILSSFCVGLSKAFNKRGCFSGSVNKMLEKNILPDVYLSFNVTGFPFWENTLDNNQPQIMWNVDSVFHQNYALIKKHCEKYNNFLLFNVTKSDDAAISRYLPNLKQAYLPHAVDPEIWQGNQEEKEHDIILTSHLCDYKANIAEIKQKYNLKYYEMFMELYEILMNNSKNTFDEVYQYYATHTGIDLNDADLYHYMFMDLCYVVTNAKRINLVNSLKDLKVKVWGPEIWTKYIENGVQYMGSSDLFDTIKNTQKAKIALHLQPLQVFQGLHERVLNASLAGAMVVSDEAPFLMSGFGDNLIYYNNISFENLPDKVEYYLKNDAARNEKVQNANKIILENHTWDNRAQMIIDLMTNIL